MYGQTSTPEECSTPTVDGSRWPSLQKRPTIIQTPRLTLSLFQEHYSRQLNEAVVQSLDRLQPWMCWAQHAPTLEETSIFVRQMIAESELGQQFHLCIFLKNSTTLIGSIGYRTIDWSVPLVEIGYWIHKDYTRVGYATEAANALTQYAIEVFKAHRVEIRCEQENRASQRVAEKLGFTKEMISRNFARSADGSNVCNIVVYARYDLSDFPMINVSWE